MTGEPAPLSGKAEVLAPRPGLNTLKQVRYQIWDRRDCGIQPGAAVLYALEGYEKLIPTITHTLGEHEGMVVRAYLPHPSPALLMTAPGPARNILGAGRPGFGRAQEHDPARRRVRAGRRYPHPTGARH
eukprot:5177174-Prymnesium_polylepis.1